MWCQEQDSRYMYLKAVLSVQGCVDESDCEPLGWHQWRDWRTEEQLDMLDFGLLCSRGIISILASWS